MSITEQNDGSNEDLELNSGITAQSVTDSTGGTSGSSLDAVSGSGDDATINDNFATIRQALVDAGVWT